MSKGLGEQLTYSGSSLDARETIILLEGLTVDGVITNISNAYPGLKVKVIERLEKSDFTRELTSSKIYEIKKTSNRNKPLPANQGGYELIKEPRDLKYSDGTSFLNENGNINSDTKLIEISNKIDKLPSGIYYGQYSSVENLPAISTLEQKGYAYVSSVESNVYYIYLYNGDGEEWQDSGNKFVTTELETNLSTKSQTKAPTTEAVANGIEAVDVTTQQEFTNTQKETARTNIGAQENITSMQDVQPVVAALNDRVATRAVIDEVSELRSMGYKVLKAYDPNNPNTTTFQAQVTESDTIYEIKDYFSLGERFKKVTSSESVSIGRKVYTHSTAIKLSPGSTVGFDNGLILDSTKTKVLGEGTYTYDTEEDASKLSVFLAVDIEYGTGTYPYDIDGEEDTITLSTERTLGTTTYYLTESIVIANDDTISLISNAILVNLSKTGTLSLDDLGNYTATGETTLYLGTSNGNEDIEYVICRKITLPSNIKLKFNGGKLDDGVLALNNCQIEGTNKWIGNYLKVSGTTISKVYPDWFAEPEDADKIEKAIRYFANINLYSRTYYINRPIVIRNSFSIKGDGIGDFFSKHYGNVISGKKSILQAKDSGSSHIDCILDIRGQHAPIDSNYPIHEKKTLGETARYISARLEGVCLQGNRWGSDGIWWSTPGGPSRPIVIDGCSFTNLRYGINVWGSNAEHSTNMGDVFITGSVFSANTWGIYGTGRHGIGNLNITSCLMEGNHNNAYTTGGAIYMGTNCLFGNLYMRSVELEGQPYGINIEGSSVNIILENNYFEYHKGQRNIINCGDYSTVSQNRVYIDASGVTHMDKVTWEISGCKLKTESGHGVTSRSKYKLNNCVIEGKLNGNLVFETADQLVGTSIDNIDNISILSRSYIKENGVVISGTSNSGIIPPQNRLDSIENGFPSFSSIEMAAYKSNFSFEGKYRLIFYCKNDTSNNAISSAALGISRAVFATTPISNNVFLINYLINDINEVKSFGMSFLKRSNSSRYKCSMLVLVKDTGNYNKLLGFDLNEFTGYLDNIKGNVGDLVKFDGNTYVLYKDKWVNSKDRLPAKTRFGTSEERPIFSAEEINNYLSYSNGTLNIELYGYQYFDCTINQNIFPRVLNSSRETTYLWDNSASGRQKSNTLVEGKLYKLNFNNLKTSNPHSLLFRKRNGVDYYLAAPTFETDKYYKEVAPEWAEGLYFAKEGSDFIPLDSRPDTWDADYRNYYTMDEGSDPVTYSQVVPSSYSLLSNKPDDWDTSWTSYYEKADEETYIPVISDKIYDSIEYYPVTTNGGSTGYAYINAPNTTEYPYIAIGGGWSAPGVQQIYIYESELLWVNNENILAGNLSGTISTRPTLDDNMYAAGYKFFDTDLGKPIYWNGTAWFDNPNVRPVENIPIGFEIYDIELKKPIYWDSYAWRDGNGNYIFDNSGTLQNRLALTSLTKGQQFKLTREGETDVYLIYGDYGWLNVTDRSPWYDDTGALNAMYDKYNYTLLTEEPSTWATTYNTYYKIVDGVYTKLTTLETWASDTYYNKDENVYIGIQVKLTDDDTELYNKVVKWNGTKYINIVDNVALKAGTPTLAFGEVEEEIDGEQVSVTQATITSTSSGKIYYTKNGDAPTSASSEYSNPIDLATGDQVKAICIRDHMDNSNVGFVPVSTPVITFNDGILAITCDTADAKIYYTTDGSTPTTSSTEYDSSASVTIAKGVTVNAFAVLIGRVNSDVASKKRS